MEIVEILDGANLPAWALGIIAVLAAIGGMASKMGWISVFFPAEKQDDETMANMSEAMANMAKTISEMAQNISVAQQRVAKLSTDSIRLEVEMISLSNTLERCRSLAHKAGLDTSEIHADELHD